MHIQGDPPSVKSHSGPILKSHSSSFPHGISSNGTDAQGTNPDERDSSSLLEDAELKKSGFHLKKQIADLGKEIQSLSMNLRMSDE